MKILAQYIRVLRGFAHDLGHEHAGHWDPIDLCRRMGVQIRRESTQRQRLLVDSKEGPVVVLPERKGAAGSHFERFIVAHELGHLILRQACMPSPLGRSEYWEHERLCDWFARQLLLPDTLMLSLLKHIPETGIQYLNLSVALTRNYFVSWRTAVDRISELRPDVTFYAVKPEPDRRSRVAYSTARRRKAQRLLLSREERLSDLANNHRGNDIVNLQEEHLSRLVSPGTAAGVAVWRAGELRVVALCFSRSAIGG